MSTLLVIGGAVASFVLLVARALAIDEVRGRLQQRIAKGLEDTIESMPDALRAEWAEEWRAELAAVQAMPDAAARSARRACLIFA